MIQSLRISQTVFKHNSYVLLILMATFFPLQGFWNALIYFRPRYQQSQKSHRRSSFFSSTKNSEEGKSGLYSKHSENKSSSSYNAEVVVLDLEDGGSVEEGQEQENQTDLSEECSSQEKQPPESAP
mgnify:CR=1 FL=1